MFNIGFGELAIICIVLIIAVGPERLPSMMKTLGKTIRTLRQASRDIRASTGIDELLREDFDLYSPPTPPRRPAYVPPTPDPVAPAPVSRQEPIDVPPPAPSPTEPASAAIAADAPAPSPTEPASAAIAADAPAPVAPAVTAALLGGAAPQAPAEPAHPPAIAPVAEPSPAHDPAAAPHPEPPKQSDS